MNINYSKTIDVSDESGSITEPVTVQEVKDYLRLEGFVDAGDSTSTDLSDFTYDDDLIEELITAVRERFEEICGISIVPKTLKSMITNVCGFIEIPYGPVSSITSLKDDDDNDLDYTLSGFLGDFPNLKDPCYCDMVMIYEAGYGNTGCPAVPKALKMDILRCVAYYYENRGYKEKVDEFIVTLAKSYKRNVWLA